MISFSRFIAATAGLALACASLSAQAEVLFWSTQAKPVQEAQAMREQVLGDFSGGVDYQPNDNGRGVPQNHAEAVKWYRRAAEPTENDYAAIDNVWRSKFYISFNPAEEGMTGFLICSYFNPRGEHGPESSPLKFRII